MRKLYSTLICSLAISASLLAQNITLDPGSAYISGDASSIAEAHATLTNNGPADQLMTWSRKVNDIPEGWESSVCDPNLCWAPFADAPSYGFTLTSGGTGNTYIKFDARNMPSGPAIPGNGYVEVCFYSMEDSANYNVTGVYTADLTAVGFYSPSAQNNYAVYPNPAVNEVNLLASYSSNIESVNIVNIVGKVVSSSAWAPEAGIMALNIRNLAEGIYFVQFINSQNEIVVTKKLAVKK